MQTYTIGQVAERSGFSASALRYYGQHGLLEPVGRTGAGYRLYDDSSLDRLEFIRRAKELGCALEEISDLAALWEAEDCGPVQARLHELVTDKITESQRRSTELIRFTAQLQTAATHLGGPAPDGPCSDQCACLSDATSNDAAARSAASTSVPIVFGARADPAIACTLPAGELPGRADEWQQLVRFVTSREPIGHEAGVRLVFGPDVPVQELARLAAAEQGCCGFFAFAITVDHRGVALEVRAPAEALDLVTTMFGPAS